VVLVAELVHLRLFPAAVRLEPAVTATLVTSADE
jgi:hypothetical protein